MITTVVGNYPKVPSLSGGPNLRTSISRFDEGKITLDELAAIEDAATKDAIEEQVRAGVDLVSDGQIRWDDSVTYLASRIEGFSISGLIRYFDSNTYYRQPVIEGELAWKEPILVKDYQFAAEVSQKPVKAIITGPFTMAKLSKNSHYESHGKAILALAKILNQEAKALEKGGASFIQFDEPCLLKAKEEFPLFKEAMGILTEGVSAKKALYTYFGDVSGLVPQLFNLPFEVFGLDFVAGPANYSLINGFPPQKELGLGIIDARNTKMETVEEMVDAVRRVLPHVPLGRLYLNPNCGLDFLPRRNAYNKLTRMVEGARRAQEVLS